jgi:AsmA protein
VSQRITAASPITNVALSNGRLSLPLVIAGTWQNPSYQLDTGMFTAKIQEAGKQKFNEAVQGLLKGTTKPEDLRRQGSDLLKGFLGR